MNSRKVEFNELWTIFIHLRQIIEELEKTEKKTRSIEIKESCFDLIKIANGDREILKKYVT